METSELPSKYQVVIPGNIQLFEACGPEGLFFRLWRCSTL